MTYGSGGVGYPRADGLYALRRALQKGAFQKKELSETVKVI